MKNATIVLLIVTLCQASNVLAGPIASGWRAGVAKVNITPDNFMWMGGYAGRNRPAEGKLTDLWAKALVLQDEKGRQGVLITLDICSFPKEMSDRLFAKLQQQKKLSRDQVIFNCSHTHSGPVVMNSLFNIYPLDSAQVILIKNYTETLEKKILEAVDLAFASMQQVQISAGNGMAKFQVNRRNNNEGLLLLQSELKGPNDFAVPVLRLMDEKGKILALLFGYACHNTVLDGYQWSGDYAGFAQIELEKSYPGAIAMFFQGAGADLNPLPRRTIPLALQYGRELAYAVEKVVREEMAPLNAEFASAYTEISLTLNDPPKQEDLIRLSEDSSSWFIQRAAKRLKARIDKKESVEKTCLYPVQIWKLGNLPVFTLGGEVVVDYAIALKKLFGLSTFVMGYSNDVMAYIPSTTILRESNMHGQANVFYDPVDKQKFSYEGGLDSQLEYGLPSTWRADIENIILGAALRLAEEVNVPLAVYK